MTEIKEPIKITKESVEVIRFSIDNETKKIQIEGKSNKYNEANILVNSEPIRLIFRGDDFVKAKDFILNNEIEEKLLHMLMRKLEIDRNLVDNTLCNSLPEGVPPYKNE